MPASPAKILVLRGGALGDFIVTLPALAALRGRWPAAEIHLVGNATAAQLARARGLIDHVHSQHEARWAALFTEVPLPDDLGRWLGEFDLIVNFWPDPEGTVSRHFEAVCRTPHVFLTAPAMPTRAPAAAHYLAALERLGIHHQQFWYVLNPAAPELRCGRGALPPRDCATEPERGVRAPRLQHRGAIALHPGSGSQTKNWPAEHWVELMRQLPSPLLLITGDAESDRWHETRLRQTPLEPRLCDGSLRFAAHLPLEELVRALHGCDQFLGHDSGVSHLAAACGVPCVLLFGPTDPAVWAPPAPHVTVLRRGPDLSALSVPDVLAALAARR